MFKNAVQHHRLAQFAAMSLILFVSTSVHADGGFVAPKGSFMYEPSQQALIEYDSQNQIERLTILPEFIGNARTFAWIVPVPSLPELSEAEVRTFSDLDSVTRPKWVSRKGEWGCMNRKSYFTPDESSDGIIVHDVNLLGYYVAMTISATESQALVDTLTSWGFLHDENDENVNAAIDDYVERSWFFVAMKVDSTAMDEFLIAPWYGYYNALNPVTLEFSSDKMIYPMKISGISAPAQSKVHLYVISDHRMTFPGADTIYANRLTSDELRQISHYSNLHAILNPGDFLTKLHRGYTPSQMDEDIILMRADSDDEFVLINYSGIPWTGLVLLVVPVGIAVKRRFWWS